MSTMAVIFAGQGAQYVGMGKDLAEEYRESRAVYDMASEILGYDIARLCFEGPDTELTRTDKCQPAIFVTSMACHAALKREMRGLAPGASAGLSLGEWAALHAAGSLTFEDTLRILEARGRFMQEACDETDGSMVSIIGLQGEDIERVCSEAGVDASNYNSAQQTVLSGPKAAIERAAELATEAGAKRAIVLRVAGAYHSKLMSSAAEKLKDTLANVQINHATVPVVSNVTGAPHGGPEEIRNLMISQVTSPVKWFDSIEWMKSTGINTYIEVGPGKVLSGLVKRVDSTATAVNVQDKPSLEKTLELLSSGGDTNV